MAEEAKQGEALVVICRNQERLKIRRNAWPEYIFCGFAVQKC
jgi:hypothetical protein